MPLIHKLSFAQMVSVGFSAQIIFIKANVLTFFLFSINEPTYMRKSNHFPCVWKVVI